MSSIFSDDYIELDGVPSPALYIVERNDFTKLSDYIETDYSIVDTSAGTTGTVAVDNVHQGNLKITTGATTNDLMVVQLTNAPWRLKAWKAFSFYARVFLSDVEQTAFFIGLNGLASSVFRVGFYSSGGGSAEIKCSTKQSSTETSTSSGVSIGPVGRLFGFKYDGVSSIRFYIDGVLVATHTTNLPIDLASCITFSAQTTEGNANYLLVDYYYVIAERQLT